MTDQYRQHVNNQREQKEQYFASSEHSPIPPESRGEGFPGLAYFEPDPDYQFELPLHRHEEVESIRVGTTTEGEREYLRWGEFRFVIDGEQYTLQAYKSQPDEPRLWVPFRDETNDEETYGAGRYLDLEEEHHQTADGTWVLDFNFAYNPTCAYNEAYECPLIPMENWLDVRIEAGEKKYPGEPVTAHDR